MYKKIVFLLSKKQKKQILILFFLLVIGIFFEMLGLGVLVPVFSGMLNPQKLLEYHFFQNNTTKTLLLLPKSKIVLIFMSILIIVYIINRCSIGNKQFLLDFLIYSSLTANQLTVS